MRVNNWIVILLILTVLIGLVYALNMNTRENMQIDLNTQGNMLHHFASKMCNWRHIPHS